MSNRASSLERIEDAALLAGQARFVDDLPEPGNCLHLAILRASEGHTRILSLELEAARALPGVMAVLSGADVAALSKPLMVGVRLPIDCWPIAQDSVRYHGEPVALVVERSRDIAEDALALIDVDYEKLPAVVTLHQALEYVSLLYENVGTNLISDRSFHYGDPERAFAGASHNIEIAVSYPRNSVTPIECYGLIAQDGIGPQRARYKFKRHHSVNPGPHLRQPADFKYFLLEGAEYGETRWPDGDRHRRRARHRCRLCAGTCT